MYVSLCVVCSLLCAVRCSLFVVCWLVCAVVVCFFGLLFVDDMFCL